MPKFAGLLVFEYLTAGGKPTLWTEELQVIEAGSLSAAQQEYERRAEAGQHLTEDGAGQRLYRAFPLREVAEEGAGPTLLLSRRFADLELYRRSVTLSE